MGPNGLRLARLGLVGVGPWGRRYLGTIARRTDCRIVAYARASKGGEVISTARRSSNWEELLEMGRARELDGLIVAAPPEVQAEVTEAAISSAVPILVEKPLALSTMVSDKLLQLYRRGPSDTLVMVDYIHLWAPAFRALAASIRPSSSPSTGVAAIESAGHNRGPFRSWSPLHDYAPHDLSMCLQLLGRNAPVRLEQVQQVVGPDAPEGRMFSARLRIGSVPVAIKVGNGTAAKARRFAVTMTDGRELVYDDTLPHPLKLRDDGQPVPVDETPPLDLVVADYVALLRGDATAKQDRAEMTARSLELTAKITNAIVLIDEAVTA